MTAQVRNKVSSYRTSPKTIGGGSAYNPNSYVRPPTAANQNWRGPPAAANQNFAKGFRVGMARVPSLAYAARANALLFGAITAYELWLMFNRGLSSPQRVRGYTGWEVTMNCSGGNIPFGDTSKVCNDTTLKTTWNTWNAAGALPAGPFAVGGYARYHMQVLRDAGTDPLRYHNSQAMHRDLPTGTVYEKPRYDPYVLPRPNLGFEQAVPVELPHIYPQLDPFALPFHVPLPIPRPLPVKFPKPNNLPGRSLQESPSRGPKPRPRPEPAPGAIASRVIPTRDLRVRVETSRNHVRMPPPSREKEKK